MEQQTAALQEKPTLTSGELYHKRMLRHSRIRTLCSAAMLALAVILFFFAADALKQVGAIMRSVDAVTAEVEQADISGMLKEVRALVLSAQGTLDETAVGMQATLDKMESIDIETLNGAINDLAAVVEPLASLFGR